MIDALGQLLIAERTLTHAVRQTRAAKRLAALRANFLQHLHTVSRSHDLALMIATERMIVEGDLEHYANSTSMVNSLKTALNEIAAIERHMAIVGDANTYKIVDHTHSLPKNRRSGLPHDEARQALASHHARLDNLDKSRLDETEKDLIDGRKDLMASAGARYRQQQAKTLGISLPPDDVAHS